MRGATRKMLVLSMLLAVLAAACGGGDADTAAGDGAASETAAASEGAAPEDAESAGAESDGAASEGGAAEGDPIVIGVSLPLTGDFADPGTGVQQGYEVWAADVNAAGGLLGRPVELRILDDASDPDRAVADYERLISQDQVDLVFGPFSSRLVIPTSAVAEREGYLFLEPAGASPEVFARGLEYIFYTAPATADRHGDLVAEYLLGLPEGERPATVAYTKLDDPFALPIAEGVQAQLEEDGSIETVLDETYPPEQSNFQPLAQQIAAADPDVLIAGTLDVDSIGLVRALKELGYQPDLIMMSTGPTTANFAEEVGGADGVLAPVGWSINAEYESNEAFVESFREMFDADPVEDMANGYTTGQIMQQAVEAVGAIEDQDALRDYVRENTFDTVVGPLGFDETGAPTGNHLILQWQDDEQVIVLAPDEAAIEGEIAYPKPEW